MRHRHVRPPPISSFARGREAPAGDRILRRRSAAASARVREMVGNGGASSSGDWTGRRAERRATELAVGDDGGPHRSRSESGLTGEQCQRGAAAERRRRSARIPDDSRTHGFTA